MTSAITSYNQPFQLKDADLWRHFQRNFTTDEFQCNYCGKRGKINGISADILRNHLLDNHNEIICKIVQKRPIIKLPPAIIQAYETNDLSDEWLEKLALDGYPIRQILTSILSRNQEDSGTFAKYLDRRARALKGAQFKVQTFFPKLPTTMEGRQIIPILMDKYCISTEGAQFLLQDFYWAYQNEYIVLTQLTRRGFTVIKHEQDRTNAVIVFCDQQMRSSFNKFGDVVCVDFKPIKFKQSPKSKYNYQVGVFAGQDTNLHHTLFAVALINEDKYDNYLTAIRYFIKAMKTNCYPQSFVLGSYGTLYQVLKDLSQENRMNGGKPLGFFLGWHYLIDKLAKMYTNEKDLKQKDKILHKFMSILASLNKQQMQYKIFQLLEMYPHDQQLHRFISQNIDYFPASNDPIFLGFGIEKQNFAILYKIMYSFLRQVDNFGSFFQKCLKMQDMLLSRIKKRGYQNMAYSQLSKLNIKFSDELQFLNRRLQRRLFKKFLYVYNEAVRNMKIVGKNNDNLDYKICSKIQGKDKMIYCVRYCLQQLCWKCNCNFIYASGIPCSHLIKIIRKFRGSLSYYINRRWMIHNNKFNPELPLNSQQLTMQAQRQSQNQQQQQGGGWKKQQQDSDSSIDLNIYESELKQIELKRNQIIELEAQAVQYFKQIERQQNNESSQQQINKNQKHEQKQERRFSDQEHYLENEEQLWEQRLRNILKYKNLQWKQQYKYLVNREPNYGQQKQQQLQQLRKKIVLQQCTQQHQQQQQQLRQQSQSAPLQQLEQHQQPEIEQKAQYQVQLIQQHVQQQGQLPVQLHVQLPAQQQEQQQQDQNHVEQNFQLFVEQQEEEAAQQYIQNQDQGYAQQQQAKQSSQKQIKQQQNKQQQQLQKQIFDEAQQKQYHSNSNDKYSSQLYQMHKQEYKIIEQYLFTPKNVSKENMDQQVNSGEGSKQMNQKYHNEKDQKQAYDSGFDDVEIIEVKTKRTTKMTQKIINALKFHQPNEAISISIMSQPIQ